MQKTLEYIEQNKEQFLKELEELLRFPTVSTQDSHKKDIADCAGWLKEHFESLGLEAEVIETAGHPIVQAKTKGQSSKRLIIYGHYDVQPEDPIEQWNSKPFEPEVRDGHIFARGASDDKGQFFAHVKAIEAILKTNRTLPCEIIFLIEGEEESGGTALAKYIYEQKENLDCDAVIVSDSNMYDEVTPAITYCLRGIVSLEVTVKGPNVDVHSGAFGGAVGNPICALTNILSKCQSADGKINIPGFYDDVKILADCEKENIKKLNYDDSGLLKRFGLKNTFGSADISTLEKLWSQPTFDINGIYGGYSGQGSKTVIPSSATAKITMRLVPDQKPEKIGNLAIDYIKSICPDFVDIEIDGPAFCAEPIRFDVNDPMIKAGAKALEKGFGAEAVFIGCGGSIPVVDDFWQQLKKPVILMGFGLDSDAVHSPNENFKIENFINAIKTSAYFLANM